MNSRKTCAAGRSCPRQASKNSSRSAFSTRIRSPTSFTDMAASVSNGYTFRKGKSFDASNRHGWSGSMGGTPSSSPWAIPWCTGSGAAHAFGRNPTAMTFGLGGVLGRGRNARPSSAMNRRTVQWCKGGSMPELRHGLGDATGARQRPPCQDGGVLHRTSCNHHKAREFFKS